MPISLYLTNMTSIQRALPILGSALAIIHTRLAGHRRQCHVYSFASILVVLVSVMTITDVGEFQELHFSLGH